MSKIIQCIKDYVGAPVTIVDARQDPVLSYSMAIETKEHGCFIINLIDKEWVIHTEFALEPNQTLYDLVSSEKGLANNIFF